MLYHGNLIYDSAVYEYRSLLRSLENPPIYHTYQEQKRVAYLMAKQGSEHNFFDRLHVFTTPPASVGIVFWEGFKGKSFSCFVSTNGKAYPNCYVFVPN